MSGCGYSFTVAIYEVEGVAGDDSCFKIGTGCAESCRVVVHPWDVAPEFKLAAYE